jgi:hypothetical protein
MDLGSVQGAFGKNPVVSVGIAKPVKVGTESGEDCFAVAKQLVKYRLVIITRIPSYILHANVSYNLLLLLLIGYRLRPLNTQGGGEKRKLFSEKMEKIRRNRNIKYCWKQAFYREKFSPEKTYFRVFSSWILFSPEHRSLYYGAQTRG